MRLFSLLFALVGLCLALSSSNALAKELKSSVWPDFQGLRDDEPDDARQLRVAAVDKIIARERKNYALKELKVGEVAFEIEKGFGESPQEGELWNDDHGGWRVVQVSGDSVQIKNQGRSKRIDRSNLASFSEVDSVLSEYLRDHAKDSYTWQRRALCRLIAKRSDGAISDITEAIRLKPQNAGFYTFRATLWMFQNRLEPAIADCDEAHRLEPKNPEPLGLRAAAHILVSNDPVKALPNLEEAIRLGKKDSELFALCGFIKSQDGRLKDAVTDYTAALEVLPADAVDLSRKQFTYYGCRAAAHFELYETDRAIADVTRAIELEPTVEALFANRAVMNSRLGNYSKAIQDYDRALKLNPDFYKARIDRGSAFISLGELDKAIEDFSEVLRRDANSFDAYMGRGQVRHYKKDFDLAIEDFSAAARIKSDDEAPLSWRAKCWQAKGDDIKAEYDLKAMREIEEVKKIRKEFLENLRR